LLMRRYKLFFEMILVLHGPTRRDLGRDNNNNIVVIDVLEKIDKSALTIDTVNAILYTD
jgi:hypothetical protein